MDQITRNGGKKRPRSERETEQTRARAREWGRANKERAAEKARAWRAANPERAKELDRARYQRGRETILANAKTPERKARKSDTRKASYAADPQRHLLKHRAWNYSLSVERVRELLDAGCSVCGSRDDLHIDHDHRCCSGGSSPRSCGQCVRGVLCHGCNTALGLLGEDPDRIAALLQHVRSRA